MRAGERQEDRYFLARSAFASFACSAGVSVFTDAILPLMASTCTSIMFLDPGFATSNDQMSKPFSFSSSELFTVPPGTFAKAIARALPSDILARVANVLGASCAEAHAIASEKPAAAAAPARLILALIPDSPERLLEDRCKSFDHSGESYLSGT
jgi:hypothetical protein